MPIVSPGYARAFGVGLLVAARTVQSGNTFALRTSNYVGEVTLTAVPLLWVIGGGVTVYAARMGQNRINLLPGGEAGGDTTHLTVRAGDKYSSGKGKKKEAGY
jgi:hypothetical protein